MQNRTIALTLVLILVGCCLILTPDTPMTLPFVAPLPVQPATPAQPTLVLKTVMQQVAKPREYGSVANRQVQAYLETQMRMLKLNVTRQPFQRNSYVWSRRDKINSPPPQPMLVKRTCTNIIGTRTGMTPKTIIIGSHFDSVANTPGADDNASGTAVNLLLAESLSQQKLTHTVKHVFFDCEEEGLIGSNYYAKNMREQCVFMINLDMIGHVSAKVELTPDESFSRVFQLYPWARAISYRSNSPIGRDSDQAPFVDKGIPAVWIFTGLHDKYHEPTDTIDTLNLKGMEKVRQYLTALILDFDKSGKVQGIETLKPASDYKP